MLQNGSLGGAADRPRVAALHGGSRVVVLVRPSRSSCSRKMLRPPHVATRELVSWLGYTKAGSDPALNLQPLLDGSPWDVRPNIAPSPELLAAANAQDCNATSLTPLFDGVRAHEKALSSSLVVSDVRGGECVPVCGRLHGIVSPRTRRMHCEKQQQRAVFSVHQKGGAEYHCVCGCPRVGLSERRGVCSQILGYSKPRLPRHVVQVKKSLSQPRWTRPLQRGVSRPSR